MNPKKIAIGIMTYKAATTIIPTIERIPSKIRDRCTEIYVIDDASPDNGHEAVLDYKNKIGSSKINVYKNKKNLGFGGNSKLCLNYAIKKNYDIVVILHGDGQYPPEKIPEFIDLIEKNSADMVIGSRMKGRPLKEGMPIWKYFGNKFLTYVQNKATGLNLSESGSGYKAYSVNALRKIPLDSLSDDYNFTTQLVFKFKELNLRIAEVPIPAYYAPGSNIFSETKKSIIYGIKLLEASWKFRANNKK